MPTKLKNYRLEWLMWRRWLDGRKRVSRSSHKRSSMRPTSFFRKMLLVAPDPQEEEEEEVPADHKEEKEEEMPPEEEVPPDREEEGSRSPPLSPPAAEGFGQCTAGSPPQQKDSAAIGMGFGQDPDARAASLLSPSGFSFLDPHRPSTRWSSLLLPSVSLPARIRLRGKGIRSNKQGVEQLIVPQRHFLPHSSKQGPAPARTIRHHGNRIRRPLRCPKKIEGMLMRCSIRVEALQKSAVSG